MTLLLHVQFDTISRQAKVTALTDKPQFVFELEYTSEVEEKFRETSTPHGGIFYAFHGSQVENFHSILYNGLLSHMNKVCH